MSATIRDANDAGPDTAPLPALDEEWCALVREAAVAAGVERLLREADGRARASAHAGGAETARSDRELEWAASRSLRRIDLATMPGELRPRSVVAASVEGALVRDAPVAAAASEVDAATREIRMTCQAGHFEVHREARATFPTQWSGGSARYNLARGVLRADVSASSLVGVSGCRVFATVVVPTAFDNALQRVWRLAVPGREALLDPHGAHLALAGVRGWIDLTVEAGAESVHTRRTFLRRSVSAHAPRDIRGFGPIRGPHTLEAEIPELDPEADLVIRVQVSLVSVLEGNEADYRPDAPFYAGVDFGGGGTVRMPDRALSAFKIPLTPLIENDPISVSHLGLVSRG